MVFTVSLIKSNRFCLGLTVSSIHLKGEVVPLLFRKKGKKILLSSWRCWAAFVHVRSVWSSQSACTDENLRCAFEYRCSATTAVTEPAVLSVHPKSLTLWPQPLFLVVVVSRSLSLSLSFPLSHSPFLSPTALGLIFHWCEIGFVYESICVLLFIVPFSICTVCLLKKVVRWSPLTHWLVVSLTHTSVVAPLHPLCSFCLRFLAVCAVFSVEHLVHWVAAALLDSPTVTHLGRGFFPRLKELSFPLVHADLSGLSNLLAKCLYFYSCLCGNVY